jgi:hypothetical protein
MPKMANTVKPNPKKLVMAFRKAAKKLGCDKSEQRFQETLFAIGTQKIGDARKPVGPFSKRSRPARAQTRHPEKKHRTKDDQNATPALD